MEHFLVLALVVGALALFALEVVRADLVALGVALVLLLTGTVTVAEGFSGFSNPAVITVIAMFVLSSGLIRTGVAGCRWGVASVTSDVVGAADCNNGR